MLKISPIAFGKRLLIEPDIGRGRVLGCKSHSSLCADVRLYARPLVTFLFAIVIIRNVSIKIFLKSRQDFVAINPALHSSSRSTVYAFRKFRTPESTIFIQTFSLLPPHLQIHARMYLSRPTLRITTTS
jgi:hypothetical protein